MKTSAVAEALERTLLATRAIVDAMTPRDGDGKPIPSLAGALGDSLDAALTMAHALAEDAHEREAAAEAARQAPAGPAGPAWGPTFGGPAPIPIPSGRGIVPLADDDDLAASGAANDGAHGASVTR